MKVKKTLNDIIVDDLLYQKQSIIDYRTSVISGIEDFDDPILNDEEIIPAIDKLIEYYRGYRNG
jgi:hypothetical protein